MNAVRGGSTSGAALTLNGLNGKFDDALTSALGAGDDASSRWGGFLAGTYTNVDRDSTDREAGFKSDMWGFTGGIDYRWTENLLLGVAFSYNEAESDISANGGSLDSDTWGVYGYGTYYPANGTYIDYTIGYSDSSHDQKRNISYSIQQISLATLATTGPIALPGFTTVNQSAISDTDSDEFSVSATLGHDWRTDTVKFGPYIGVAYAETDIDGFRERMNNPTAAGSGLALFVDEQDFKSLITNVGAAATFTFQGPWGPVYPYLMGQYSHEFKNGNDPITGGFIDDPNGLKFSLATDSPDRNYFNLGAGFSASLTDSSYFYTRYNGLVGYRDLSVHSVEAGLLFAF
jgi:outer membrane lipase/esterase